MLPYYYPQLMRRGKKLNLDKVVDFRIILNKSMKDKPSQFDKDIPKKAMRYLPANLELQLVIFGDKTIIYPAGKTPYIVQIQNRKIAESFKGLFELVWAMSSQ